MFSLVSGAKLLKTNGASANIYHVETGDVVLHFEPHSLAVKAAEELSNPKESDHFFTFNFTPWSGTLEYLVWTSDRTTPTGGATGAATGGGQVVDLLLQKNAGLYTADFGLGNTLELGISLDFIRKVINKEGGQLRVKAWHIKGSS